jgi:hypothetical protein
MIITKEKPKILINSVPKSGTNLLIQIAKGIPGIFQDQKTFYHSENYLEVLNIRPGEMVSSHIPYNEEFSQQLKAHSIKQLFIYRDLRDVAVSLVYFINDKLHDHPLFPVFQKRIRTFEEQLNAIICGVQLIGDEKQNIYGIEEYPGIFREYLPIYKWIDDPTICSVRFEDLVCNKSSKEKEILKIIDFLWGDLGYLGIDKLKLLKKMKQNINPKESWTYRKGVIGNWRNEFTLDNKKNFKEKAGDFLVKYGYEKNGDW